MHEIGGIEDHVHLLVSLPRTLPLSKLVEEIKKSSSKWIKTKGNLYSNFAWQSGYGAFSIGQSGYDDLRKYIQTQKEHHKKVTFQDEYRAFLKKYCIAYDEKYLWD
jgi:REP element-mobilizing transposase RayT